MKEVDEEVIGSGVLQTKKPVINYRMRAVGCRCVFSNLERLVIVDIC